MCSVCSHSIKNRTIKSDFLRSFVRSVFSHSHISSNTRLDLSEGAASRPFCGFVSQFDTHWSAETLTCSFHAEPNRSDSVLTLGSRVSIIAANQLPAPLWISINVGLMAHKSVSRSFLLLLLLQRNQTIYLWPRDSSSSFKTTSLTELYVFSWQTLFPLISVDGFLIFLFFFFLFSILGCDSAV